MTTQSRPDSEGERATAWPLVVRIVRRIACEAVSDEIGFVASGVVFRVALAVFPGIALLVRLGGRLLGAQGVADLPQSFGLPPSGGPSAKSVHRWPGVTREGFGTRLIERGLAGAVGGEVETTCAPGGVRCTLVAPLSGFAR